MSTIQQSDARDTSTDQRPCLKLLASRDRVSGHGVFPRVPERSPSAPRFESITLSDSATLYSFTVIHPNPKTGQAPFALAYADFPEDVRVFGRLDLPEGDRPLIGMRLGVVGDAAASGDGQPAYRFVPAGEAAR